MLKHKVAVTVSILAIVGVGVGVNHAYNDHQATQAKANQAVAKREDALVQEESKATATFQAQLKLDETQCAKDQVAYNALTPQQKLKTTSPDCVVNLVQ